MGQHRFVLNITGVLLGNQRVYPPMNITFSRKSSASLGEDFFETAAPWECLGKNNEKPDAYQGLPESATSLLCSPRSACKLLAGPWSCMHPVTNSSKSNRPRGGAVVVVCFVQKNGMLWHTFVCHTVTARLLRLPRLRHRLGNQCR